MQIKLIIYYLLNEICEYWKKVVLSRWTEDGKKNAFNSADPTSNKRIKLITETEEIDGDNDDEQL